MITGAASGIGKATAFAFAERHPVAIVVCDIDEAGLDDTTTRLESLGCTALPLVMDVTDHHSVEQGFARTHLQTLWFAYTRAFTAMSEKMIKCYRSD